MLQLILASQSPRRRQILSEAGYGFLIQPVKVSEFLDKNLNLEEQIIAIARRKAQALLDQDKQLKLKENLIISADTMVIINEEALGKPKNFAHAREMLTLLSGKEHCVKTAIYLVEAQSGQSDASIETTHVEFRPLTPTEIEAYIAGGEPMDKAGAYGIQGDGGKFVKRIRGSYQNVVGFPLQLFERMLSKNGWQARL